MLLFHVLSCDNLNSVLTTQFPLSNSLTNLSIFSNNYGTVIENTQFWNIVGLAPNALHLFSTLETNNNSLFFIKQNSLDWIVSNDSEITNNLNSTINESVLKPTFTYGSKKMTNYNEYSLYMFERELERRHRLRPDLTKEQLYDLWTGSGSDSMAYSLEHSIPLPTDYSNLYDHNGTIIDISKLSNKEIALLVWEIDDVDKIEKIESMAHLRSMYQASVPHVKLYYPEPFIASPSFIHNDIWFIHILQYQYWLWFVFVFLIVFFFLSFLTVSRWCSMRTQPRRETRGVSRSKCGDLITACVPVTWAASIIVSESTDAMDLYDGFGAGELVIGVRAYQWGWEYYYPKNLDLQYNVRPSYASFIGNSLKYNSASEKTLNTSHLWKFYQNKKEDLIVTPAHLLTLPLDNNKVFNFMNFKNIGANTAQESSAFKKVRTFSKTYSTNLVHNTTNFTNKYSKLNSLYTNESNLYDSFNYGLKRQHNLTSTAATTNTYSTFLDKSSMDKFLNYNLQYNTPKSKTDVFFNNINSFSKKETFNINLKDINKFNILHEFNSEFNSKQLNQLLTHPNIILELNDNTDGSTIKLPIKKILNPHLSRNNLVSDTNILNSVDNNLTTSSTLNQTEDSLSNVSTTTKTFKPFSDGQSILPSDQSVRKFSKMSANDSNLNLSLGLNTIDSNLKSSSNSLTDSSLNTYSESKSGWLNQSVSQKLSNNSLFLEAPYSPILSNNPYLVDKEFDTTSTKKISTSSVNNSIKRIVEKKSGESVMLLSGRRDNAIKALSSAYWKMFWSNSNVDLRLDGALKHSLNSDLSYLPLFTNYYDYDFRNAQSLELLEDCFWDTSYSSFNYTEYLNISDNYNKSQSTPALISRRDSYYYKNNTNKIGISNGLGNPLSKDLSLTGSFYANNIQFDDFITPSNLLNTKDFFIFPLINNLSTLDDSYSSYKNSLMLFNKNSSFFLSLNLNYSYPQSYISVLNNFRADFDDFSWYVDMTSFNKNIKPNLTLDNTEVELNESELQLNDPQSNLTRFSNPITLRSTARNSIVTYNALQKVFKARFEDGRSNTKIVNFGNLAVAQPFITTGRLPYEKLLGKNKDSYYNTTFYKNNTFKVFNDLAPNTNSLNYYFFDFPFLLSGKSDPSRYAWFDWFAKWAVFEVQPSSVSRYSTIGVPYTKKNFDFNIETSDAVNDAETYFTRISRARKNYLPHWLYTPYLYSRSTEWSKSDKLFLFNNTNADISNTSLVLKEMDWFWTSLFFTDNTSAVFTPSNSGNNIYGKSVWRPFSSISAYYYHTSNLIDILSKREYIYRQYFETNNKIINLPSNFTANPSNPLIEDFKSSFLFVDPINYNSEYSRELYYNSLSFFKFILLKDYLLSLNGKVLINLDILNDYLFYYFLNSSKPNNLGNNFELYKNQYRPLKKGISSMLRLHATGAVALPTEIRLQVLASSRDVIHSWSIPSAGIKIDCVPGYTSHRIMTFFNCGIYWGQCQEICGRYHHWMPIVLYFMKRDLFFLWCTHFIYNSGVNDMWEINDRQFADYIRFVSYDQHTWLSEIEKQM